MVVVVGGPCLVSSLLQGFTTVVRGYLLFTIQMGGPLRKSTSWHGITGAPVLHAQTPAMHLRQDGIGYIRMTRTSLGHARSIMAAPLLHRGGKTGAPILEQLCNSRERGRRLPAWPRHRIGTLAAPWREVCGIVGILDQPFGIMAACSPLVATLVERVWQSSSTLPERTANAIFSGGNRMSFGDHRAFPEQIMKIRKSRREW